MNLYRLGRHLLPRRIRAGLRHTLQQVVLPGPAYQLQLLVKRVESLEAQVFHLSPPEIEVTPEVERYVERFRKDYSIRGPLEIAVSKRDTMFRYLEYFQADLRKAYWEYLRTGLQAYEALEALVTERFGGFEKLDSLLDFASGYGRLTRFLVRALPPERIWVSDIKERAVAFQREKFGVEGFAAPLSPADFPPAMRFDVVFVASLFTHLPEEGFAAWLETLCGRLSARGMLVVSTNDVSQVPDGGSKEDFVYRDVSEEALFRYLDDDAPEGDAYGTTYVSEAYVRGLLEGLGFARERVRRLPEGLWDSQDLYVIHAG